MNKNLIKLLSDTAVKNYNQGFTDGQIIMRDVFTLALYDVFADTKIDIGKLTEEDWIKIEDRANDYVDDVVKHISEGEPELGFEHICLGMRRVRDEEYCKQLDKVYDKVLYHFNEH